MGARELFYHSRKRSSPHRFQRCSKRAQRVFRCGELDSKSENLVLENAHRAVDCSGQCTIHGRIGGKEARSPIAACKTTSENWQCLHKTYPVMWVWPTRITPGGPPSWVGVSTVSYSPTPHRVQYHRRWGA